MREIANNCRELNKIRLGQNSCCFQQNLQQFTNYKTTKISIEKNQSKYSVTVIPLLTFCRVEDRSAEIINPALAKNVMKR